MIVDDSQKLPIKAWTDWNLLYRESELIKQAYNLANHPLSMKWICLMPDFHTGYGMPIGGVLATKDGVIPNAVGVDIGCGMIAAKTNLNVDELSRSDLENIRKEIHARVPVGNSRHKNPVSNSFTHDLGISLPTRIVKDLYTGGIVQSQIGTLGGGNHFIEIQKDPEDTVWVMLHSGSRGIGKHVCDHYHKIAKKYMSDFHSNIPTDELAFIPKSTAEFREYLDSMEWSMKFAEYNRQTMFEHVIVSMENYLGRGISIELQFDTHHNFAAFENHFGENMIIHRKGSVKATGLVTIPGSMGTASYIGRGLENPLSFNSCSHGAGRLMSRGVASKAVTHDEAVDMMKHVVYGTREGHYDEHPHAYKGIDEVMAFQSDLVEPVTRLEPLAVCKG